MRLWPACAALAVLATASVGHATQVPAATAKPPPPPVTVVATPIFGTEPTVGNGWYDVLVRIDNPGTATKKGSVELYDSTPWMAHEGTLVTHAPFAVPAGKTAWVRLETHGAGYGSASMAVRARDEGGAEMLNVPVTTNTHEGPVLLDIDEPSKLGIVMRGWPATTSFGTPMGMGGGGFGAYGGAAPTAIAFTAPQFDHATGDPILPARAAGYGAVTVVLVHSDALSRLQGEPLDALVNWVAGGGTLAVIPNRPEDLRNPPLAALAGGAAVAGPPAPGLLSLPTIARPGGPPGAGGIFGTPGAPGGLIPDDDEGIKWDPSVPPGPSDFIKIRTSPLGGGAPGHLGPRAAVAAKMSGYTGGNLVATVYGATSAYGLGEVHLLPFDPTTTPALDDPWVLGRMSDLVNHAWDRRASIVFPPASVPHATWRGDDVRRALDPNENFRPALGFAAIMLALYSVFVGPVTFLRARKKGNPLAPLKWAPIWSAAAFGSIVLAGLAVKGWTGRSRQIAFVETGAGFERGAVRRFRGFFTSETRSLRIAATDSASVIDVVRFDSIGTQSSSLGVDRDGLALDRITSLPWQTLVVREDGYTDLKGSVSVLRRDLPTGANVDVVNHTGKDLKDVIVWVPLDGARWFPELKNGATISSSMGTMAMNASSRRASSAGTMTVHMLEASLLASGLPKGDAQRVQATWHIIETATDENADWWPDDAPVVLAEVGDPDHPSSDSGLRVESQRLLLRVVGYGGTK